MGSSWKSETYTKPNDAPDSARITIAEIDKTVIPFNNSSFAKGVNSEYFVWRTKMDNSVRKEHLIREGKIFRKDNPADFMPGDEPNCRCEMEEVPDYIIIKDELKEKKAFELYLRKGIKHPILFRPPAQLS
jgi:SPP1 gp7 family putative phage head morphogenesis protein